MEDIADQLKKEIEEERLRLYLEKYAQKVLDKKKNKNLQQFIGHE